MSDELRRQWGQNVRLARRALGLNQSQLADAVGVRPSSVCRWEKGLAVPKDEMKVKVANVVGWDVRALFPLTRTAA